MSIAKSKIRAPISYENAQTKALPTTISGSTYIALAVGHSSSRGNNSTTLKEVETTVSSVLTHQRRKFSRMVTRCCSVLSLPWPTIESVMAFSIQLHMVRNHLNATRSTRASSSSSRPISMTVLAMKHKGRLFSSSRKTISLQRASSSKI